MNAEMECHPRPRLSLKVAYFLSDTSEPGRGNFWVIPGSHLRDKLERPADGIGQPEGAVPVLAKPGTAVFFDRRLWHTASPNWSDVTRKVLFYGYGYRWIPHQGRHDGAGPLARQRPDPPPAAGRGRQLQRPLTRPPTTTCRCASGCASTAPTRRNSSSWVSRLMQPHESPGVAARRAKPHSARTSPRRLLLWIFTGLFLGRVLGQILVAFLGVRFLPPMPEWYSGLLPYPLLLPVQIVLLAWMFYLNWGVARGRVLAAPRPGLGRFLLAFSVLYALFMVARYFISGALHPERRWWPPGTIPIVFHWVLATYLWTLGRLALRSDASPASPPANP